MHFCRKLTNSKLNDLPRFKKCFYGLVCMESEIEESLKAHKMSKGTGFYHISYEYYHISGGHYI